jgi:hypothetical protein
MVVVNITVEASFMNTADKFYVYGKDECHPRKPKRNTVSLKTIFNVSVLSEDPRPQLQFSYLPFTCIIIYINSLQSNSVLQKRKPIEATNYKITCN